MFGWATVGASKRAVSAGIGVLAVTAVPLVHTPAAIARTPTARSIIGAWMHRTIEAGSGRRFQPVGSRHTIPDGRGGAITAQVAMPDPSADGYGNLVFFFHGHRFLGWDSNHEALSIERLVVTGAGFRVRYANYAASDPLCCPSQGSVSVRYTWHRGQLRSHGTPPRPRGSRVRLGS
jgi:LppP/LprE lipoprotein